ncbi:MAG TPA: peptidylprolyl isomerase [Thermoanaerobaculia bacterium]|jgi:peptidyl-prolyl cis-trans isomerase C|nr:peptidylprolyl isomerase [Thermoanaerobaculia bacterium]
MARRSLAWLPLLALPALAACHQEAAGSAGTATPTPAPAPGSAAAAKPPAALPGTPPQPIPGHAGAPGTPGAASLPFDTGKLPAVVARVNGEPIARQELLTRAESMRLQMARMGAPEPPRSEDFYRAMIDQLVGQRLLLAEAKRRGFAPTPAEVSEQLAQIRARVGDEAYRKQLAAQGVTEQQLAADTAQNLAIQKLVTTDVAPGIKVAEADSRAFYQQNLDRMKRPAQVRVRHILVGMPQGATAEQKLAARRKAEGLLARLKAGGDFAALARESSDDAGTKSEGGLLPWLSPGESAPPFEKVAFALAPGAVSGVVESAFGFHILRLEDRRAEQIVPFEEARPQIEQLLSRRIARDLLEKKVTGLRRGAKVEVLF